MPDIHLLTVVINGGNQPELVSADVENRESPDFIDRSEHPAKFRERLEFIRRNQLKPHSERFRRFPVVGGKLAQPLSCYDVHAMSLYRILRYHKRQKALTGQPALKCCRRA